MAHTIATQCRDDFPAKGRWAGALAAALLGATAVVLALAAAVLAEPVPLDGSAIATETLVRRYYAAVNAALATGDLAMLDDVAAAAADLTADGSGPDSLHATLPERVSALRVAHPGLHIVVERVVADRDEAVAWVSLAGMSEGGPVAAPWAGSEQTLLGGFRVRGGQIVEIWGGAADLSVPAPVLQVAVNPGPGPSLVGLVRFEIAPGAETPLLSGPGPAAIAVQSGSVAVFADGAVTGGLTREAAEMERAAPRVLATLGPGGQLALAAGTPFRLRNEGDEAAAALLAVVFPIAATVPLTFDNAGLDVRSLLVDVVQAPDGLASHRWPLGVAVQRLAGQRLTVGPSGPWRLDVARITLAPGTVAAHWRPAGHVLLAVERGAVLIAAGETARGERARPVILAGDSDAITIAPGTHVSVRGAGDEPAAVILLSLRDAAT